MRRRDLFRLAATGLSIVLLAGRLAATATGAAQEAEKPGGGMGTSLEKRGAWTYENDRFRAVVSARGDLHLILTRATPRNPKRVLESREGVGLWCFCNVPIFGLHGKAFTIHEAKDQGRASGRRGRSFFRRLRLHPPKTTLESSRRKREKGQRRCDLPWMTLHLRQTKREERRITLHPMQMKRETRQIRCDP